MAIAKDIIVRTDKHVSLKGVFRSIRPTRGSGIFHFVRTTAGLILSVSVKWFVFLKTFEFSKFDEKDDARIVYDKRFVLFQGYKVINRKTAQMFHTVQNSRIFRRKIKMLNLFNIILLMYRCSNLLWN